MPAVIMHVRMPIASSPLMFMLRPCSELPSRFVVVVLVVFRFWPPSRFIGRGPSGKEPLPPSLLFFLLLGFHVYY